MEEARLENYLDCALREWERVYGRDEKDKTIETRMPSLIRHAYEQTGEPVVVLIDEYDAPPLDVVREETELPKLRKIVRNFYSPLKMSPRSKHIIAYSVAFLLLASGLCIYLTYRSESLVMFRWAEWLGLMGAVECLRAWGAANVPADWVVYSLPDGMWSTSYVLTMCALWGRERSSLVVMMPAVAVLSEVLQAVHICPGTFDWTDLLFYALPAIVYLTINFINNKI